MEYNFRELEKYWQFYWKINKTFYVKEKNQKKYYILNMFPYPSGSGLHLGHCLGYIASDIYARYKRGQGFNVLHPMGFDSFGLPAEQYAIQTGRNPNDTTCENENRYQKQINRIGISFNWERKIKTSHSKYYLWTQWMFTEMFNSWYDKKDDKAKPIYILIHEFEKYGNKFVQSHTSYEQIFNHKSWNTFNSYEKENILQHYRIAFLKNSLVNWCPELNTVLANDEIKNEKSIRGGYQVYKKNMIQWHLRITAYADRLIKGLKLIKCSTSLKKSQINWIGKSKIFSIKMEILYKNKEHNIEELEFNLYYPELIFGITFIVLSTHHFCSKYISHNKYNKNVIKYIENNKGIYIKNNYNKISYVFTGNYALHPVTKNKIPIYISDFFYLNNECYKSILGIPEYDIECNIFAKKLKLNKIFVLDSYLQKTSNRKEARLKILKCLNNKIKNKNIYKIHDAIFSRQRYWGEPIPIYFKKNIPFIINKLPIYLPIIKNFLSKNENTVLSKIKNWAWDEKKMKIVSTKLIDQKYVFPMETQTMPSWAGSSWYFLRYMDVNNNKFFISKEKEKYWKNVDIYIGGSEHSNGHLIYARFWNKFLKDRGWIKQEEPFKKIFNQGMILSHSAIILKVIGKKIFVSYGLNKKNNYFSCQKIYVNISCIEKNNILNIKKFYKYHPEFYHSVFILNKGIFYCKRKLEKMSKSKYNIINPDEIINKYGTDVLRMYEMFLGPIKQSKPWDGEKIVGIKNFLKKFWNLFHKNGKFNISEKSPNIKEFKILHETIKKVDDKIHSFSFNTCISFIMITVKKLLLIKCNKKKILEPLLRLISPFAPHISEELWHKLGNKYSITYSRIPKFNKKYFLSDKIKYLVMFNGKTKFIKKFNLHDNEDIIKNKILNNCKTKLFLNGNSLNDIKKIIIIIPKKIINILF